MNPNKSRTIVRAAATIPGEYELISAVAADLRDEIPKLIYADWLEERGDRRTSLVRKLAAAMHTDKDRTKFPHASGYPEAWRNMLGYPLFEGIIAQDLLDVQNDVLRLARPILDITTMPSAERHLPIGGSKFGGCPDLPADGQWPRCEKGPLGFLGQIALHELAFTQVAHSLPRTGLLSFFAYQDHVRGYQPGFHNRIAGDTCVRYVSEGMSLKRCPPPDDLNTEGNAILPTYRLMLCESWDLPRQDDQLPCPFATALRKFQRPDLADKLHEVRHHCSRLASMRRPAMVGSHHLLGYSKHSRCGSDPSPGKKWLNLLCLGSDDRLRWSWCDGEHLSIFVHEDDLRTSTFGRVYGYCS